MNKILRLDYCPDGQPLVCVDQVKDFGYLNVSSVDFRPHIDFIACTALYVLGFIRWHSSNFDSLKYLSSLYNVLVRSLLEYGAVFWYPYNKSDVDWLDKVQNHFFSFAVNRAVLLGQKFAGLGARYILRAGPARKNIYERGGVFKTDGITSLKCK